MQSIKINASIMVKARVPKALSLEEIKTMTKQIIKDGNFIIRKQKIEVEND